MLILSILFLSAVFAIRFTMHLYRLFRVKPKYYNLCLARLLCNGAEIVALGYIFKVLAMGA